METPRFSFVQLALESERHARPGSNDYSTPRYTGAAVPGRLPVREWRDIALQLRLPAGHRISAVGFDLGGEDTFTPITDAVGDYADPAVGYAADRWVTLGHGSPPPPCFRVALREEFHEGASDYRHYYATGCLYRDDGPYTSLVSYICEASEFGFTYTDRLRVSRARLPLYLRDPTFPQEQEVYTMFSGERVTLSAAIGKEWTLEAGYLRAEEHERLVVALSHDRVWVDGRRLTKRGEYAVGWGSTLAADDGAPLAKGSCTLAEHATLRNGSEGGAYDEASDFFFVTPAELRIEAA
jgi:hypothetical protein